MLRKCHQFIPFAQVKTGPFAEHSNQLWNISGVPNWEKVNSGLFKMYKAEVSIFSSTFFMKKQLLSAHNINMSMQYNGFYSC